MSRDFAAPLGRLHAAQGACYAGDSATIDGAEHRWSTVGLSRFRGELVAACWLLPLDPVAFDRIWT